MQEFKDKYQFKNYIAKIVSDIDISQDVFDSIFSNVFFEIFEKEKQYPCIFNFYKTSIVEQIIREIKELKKENKKDFLLMFEDYQKLNNELNELILKIKIKCGSNFGNCNSNKDCKIDIKDYPLFYRCIERKDLKVFKPDLIPSAKFLNFFEKNAGKHGLYFLYNLRKELLFVGKSSNLGQNIINAVWEMNVDGYISVAYTKTKSDIHLYEPFYIIKEKPLLNTGIMESDELSIGLKPLKKSALIKIYENN
jgi:hypothetical protein